jgi:hypothetical protein
LATLCLCWAGEDGARDGVLDPAIISIAGLDPGFTLEDLRAQWGDTSAEDHERFWWALLRRLYNHRLMSGGALRLGEVPFAAGGLALVAQDADTSLFAAGHLIDQRSGHTSAWVQPWESITGLPFTIDDAPATETQRPLDGSIPAVLADPHANLILTLTASGILRVWARWLRQFHRSSDAYLLNNLIRRPGSLRMDDQRIVVILESRPLDLVLEMAAYLSPIEAVEWLGKRHVTFHFESR